MSDANSTEQPGPTGTSRPRREPGSVHVLLDHDRTLVVLAGDVDAALAPDLLEASAEVIAADKPVRIDTRNVTFMDSSGVAFLARVAVGGRGRRPVVLDPPDHVQFLLDITAISGMVEVRRGADGAAPRSVLPDDETSPGGVA